MRPMLFSLLCLFLVQAPVCAQGLLDRSTGQMLYLPVYSHIWHGDVDAAGAPRKTLLSVLVSIRNVSLKTPIRLTSSRYYDTHGKLIKDYVPAPKIIGPMGTYEIYIPRSDDTGGSGANFVVVWQSDKAVDAPVVEAVHANLPAGRAIAFTTSARPMRPD